jgi:hypothetical protein
MKGIELLETYPKAAEVIGEFYNKKLIDSMSDISDDVSEGFKEMLKQQSFDNEYIASFIDSNPRFLFDVFDANDIYIQITVDLENKCFRYSFDGGLIESNDYFTRIAAEIRSIETAFEILNNKLCQIK